MHALGAFQRRHGRPLGEGLGSIALINPRRLLGPLLPMLRGCFTVNPAIDDYSL